MKENEVPQDDGGLFEGKFKTLKYALDEEGNYVEVQSVGWEPETVVLNQAWDEVNEQVELARKNVIAGIWSPLSYHAYKAMMDETLLSDYMGISKARVKEHLFSPKAFQELGKATLQQYSEVLNIPLEQLQKVD
ncbi:MAG: hypothetical protein K1X82_13315 [Bacteroidia bacterium]|nr:hypothetical protein [Bacteroidia bacterium]